VLPLRDADAEVDRVDSARGGQFEALLRDLAGGELGGSEGDVVADEVREQRGLSRDELRESTRVSRAELDAGTRTVDEVKQRGCAADDAEFGAPPLPGRFGDVRE
jgi:hypothetical protein